MKENLKIVAMIPARLGSQRVPKKNLRYLGDKLLVEWVASACLKTNVFDEIYINSESTIFEQVANKIGIKYYKRPKELASNEATNDDFGMDFIEHVSCDILVQVNPTSPFTMKEDIVNIVNMVRDEGYQTVHTVKVEQIEGLFMGHPLNFDPLKKMPPSQELEPVKLFTSSVMAWETKKFKDNILRTGSAVYGGDGKIGYYSISGLGVIDIDHEKDFLLAEAMLEMESLKITRRYYEG